MICDNISIEEFDMESHIAARHLPGLPEEVRQKLKEARLAHGWSQAELGKRVGLPQTHISHIENGKIVPRFNTLIDLVRLVDYDLLMVPRALVPAVQALIRDHSNPEAAQYAGDGDQPLYAATAGQGAT
jgi:HTH-type transcriptional regulator / antitoxin HipB